MFTAIIIIIFLSVLILVHELGHFLLAKKFGIFVEEFGLGLPPRIYGKKIGETIYSINALPFGGFVKIAGENNEEGLEHLSKNQIFYNLKIWERSLILSGGVIMNFLLGWLALSVVFLTGIPNAIFIAEVQPDTPAQAADIQRNDKIIGFNTIEDFTGYINANKGKEIALKIDRLGQEIEKKITVRTNLPKNQGAFGVALVEAGQEKTSLFKGVWEGLKYSIKILGMFFSGIYHLIKLAIVGQADLSGISGPVGIVKITAQASKLGVVYLFQLLALISLNLAAFNIIPFPALDGGRLLFLAIEKIKGSPLPRKFEQYTNAAGLALLLILMILITIKDIKILF
ncbi:MAG: RIP metalloprotease RseP [Patescibacteria group bacterium]|nr:RIP metalloprotease RseP [Patescibacteria group bacterium]